MKFLDFTADNLMLVGSHYGHHMLFADSRSFQVFSGHKNGMAFLDPSIGLQRLKYGLATAAAISRKRGRVILVNPDLEGLDFLHGRIYDGYLNFSITLRKLPGVLSNYRSLRRFLTNAKGRFLPHMAFVFHAQDHYAVREASHLNLPYVALFDSNSNAALASFYNVPSNDDSIIARKFYILAAFRALRVGFAGFIARWLRYRNLKIRVGWSLPDSTADQLNFNFGFGLHRSRPVFRDSKNNGRGLQWFSVAPKKGRKVRIVSRAKKRHRLYRQIIGGRFIGHRPWFGVLPHLPFSISNAKRVRRRSAKLFRTYRFSKASAKFKLRVSRFKRLASIKRVSRLRMKKLARNRSNSLFSTRLGFVSLREKLFHGALFYGRLSRGYLLGFGPSMRNITSYQRRRLVLLRSSLRRLSQIKETRLRYRKLSKKERLKLKFSRKVSNGKRLKNKLSGGISLKFKFRKRRINPLATSARILSVRKARSIFLPRESQVLHLGRSLGNNLVNFSRKLSWCIDLPRNQAKSFLTLFGSVFFGALLRFILWRDLPLARCRFFLKRSYAPKELNSFFHAMRNRDSFYSLLKEVASYYTNAKREKRPLSLGAFAAKTALLPRNRRPALAKITKKALRMASRLRFFKQLQKTNLQRRRVDSRIARLLGKWSKKDIYLAIFNSLILASKLNFLFYSKALCLPWKILRSWHRQRFLNSVSLAYQKFPEAKKRLVKLPRDKKTRQLIFKGYLRQFAGEKGFRFFFAVLARQKAKKEQLARMALVRKALRISKKARLAANKLVAMKLSAQPSKLNSSKRDFNKSFNKNHETYKGRHSITSTKKK